MFTQGERSGIECVFDKNKTTRQSKINLVEIRVIIQSLTQRVTELEEALDSKNKTIASLRKQMQDLRSEHDQLKLNMTASRMSPHQGSRDTTPITN